MISPLVSKVNPSHLADFATHYDLRRRDAGLRGKLLAMPQPIWPQNCMTTRA